jgi:hypothetical protein
MCPRIKSFPAYTICVLKPNRPLHIPYASDTRMWRGPRGRSRRWSRGLDTARRDGPAHWRRTDRPCCPHTRHIRARTTNTGTCRQHPLPMSSRQSNLRCWIHWTIWPPGQSAGSSSRRHTRIRMHLAGIRGQPGEHTVNIWRWRNIMYISTK